MVGSLQQRVVHTYNRKYIIDNTILETKNTNKKEYWYIIKSTG